MNLLIVADIFGRTKPLDALASHIIEKKINVEIVDPYNSQYRNFETEDIAYSAFQKETGLNQYTELLKQKVKNCNTERTVIVGFSVGASALWAASPHLDEKLFKGICFYSSQIGRHLDIKPNIEIELVFATSEPRYKVESVVAHMENLKKVTCTKTQYLHGFMNMLSKNFNEAGYLKHLKKLKKYIVCYSA